MLDAARCPQLTVDVVCQGRLRAPLLFQEHAEQLAIVIRGDGRAQGSAEEEDADSGADGAQARFPFSSKSLRAFGHSAEAC